MSRDLASALCLVLVIEGLLLFAAPRSWQRLAERLREIAPRHLRLIGAGMVGIGILALRLVN